MRTLSAQGSLLLLIDLQARLLPAIAGGDAVLRNAARLVAGARRLEVPLLFTEQYPRGLGATAPELGAAPGEVAEKTTFDACRAPGLTARLAPDRAVVVVGTEAHVCVLQTVLGLIGAGRQVAVVADAIGSRTADNRTAALQRMARHGAEIVTTEMVLFEWLGDASHPAFREIQALIK
ncbi:isochorismatase family protein [Phaeovulum sp.]|uniref:isochorismatase family protein n=1 Tax=Phaeovulum sp. TaxID=2934796 RepID=UPI00356B214F